MLNGRLTDREIKRPGIGIAGKIKVGEKNEKGYPVSLDYFKAEGQFSDMFYQVFEDQPKRIQIAFISDDLTHSCNLRYELRGKDGKLFSRGDGQNFEVLHNGKWVFKSAVELASEYGSVEDFKEKAKQYCKSSKGWETRLILRFIIPKIKGLLGEWQFSTKAEKSSINQIVSAFDQVKENAGTIIMIPFDLVVEKVSGDQYGVKKRYPVVKLIPNASPESLVTVKQFIESGRQPWEVGLLTDDRVLQLKPAEGE
jgi:hypothetical protein